MPGEPDPLYVRARRALLDALEALAPHLDAVVLVGAQAVYLHTGDADLAVAEYTIDADLALNPGGLADAPLLADVLTARGFTAQAQPGAWLSPDGIPVDVMVPDALAGPGRRGARLGAHGDRVARRAKGLEGALVDHDRHTVLPLDPADPRSASVMVAGPAALLVAKVHKIAERAGDPDRSRDKDALDILRLLRAVPTDDLARRLRSLATSELADRVTREALAEFEARFTDTEAEGVVMAVRAAAGGENPETIAASLIVLARDVLQATAR